MPDPIRVSSTVIVPGTAWSWRAVRSSGPGGQNVNKVASKVELRVSLPGIEGLSEGARARLKRAVANRLDAEGLWLLTSQLTRDQGRNLEDATGKVTQIIVQALVAPRPRRPTRATKASKERRMQSKRRTASVKQQRGRVRGDD